MFRLKQKHIKLIINSCVSIIFLLYVIFLIDINESIVLILGLQPFNLLLLFVTISIILLLRAFRWSYLMRSRFIQNIPFLFYYSFQSQFINSFMPTGSGDTIKVFNLTSKIKKEKMPELISLTIIDRLLDVIIIFSGGFLTLFLLGIFPLETFIPIIVIGFFGSVMIFLVLFVTKYPNKFFNRHPRFKEQFQIILENPKRIIICFTISLVAWIFEGLKLFFLFNSLTVSVDIILSLQIALAAWSGSLLLIFISGTLGTKEYFMSYLLQEHGYNPSVSSFASVLDRFFTILVSFFVFSFFVFLGYLGFVENKTKRESNSSLD